MKTTKLVMLVMTIAVTLFILIPNLSWAADDGADALQDKMRRLPRSGCGRQARSQDTEPDFGRGQEVVRRRPDQGRCGEGEAPGWSEEFDRLAT